jgi:3-oxoacyl-[acyl-carrier protein] reductase
VEIATTSSIITGAANGIGRVIATELVRCGATVVAADVDGAQLETLARETEQLPGQLRTAVADVSAEDAVKELVGRASTAGPLNLLVNDAGVVQDGLLVRLDEGGAISLPTAQWTRVLDIDLTGAFLMAREFSLAVLASGTPASVIVNISSIASSGNAGQSNYAAAKAGLESCTRTWAQELSPYGIRVGAIAPGLIDTPMLQQLSDAALSNLRSRIWLQRVGVPYEIWQTVRFIVECDYFTGRCIQVDGGLNL